MLIPTRRRPKRPRSDAMQRPCRRSPGIDARDIAARSSDLKGLAAAGRSGIRRTFQPFHRPHALDTTQSRLAAPGFGPTGCFVNEQSVRPETTAFALLVYVVAFVTGAIVMSFEMLGSRYLNPYFGSGIYTWASLISTVLAALTVGYFIGGGLPRPPPPGLGLRAAGLVRPVCIPPAPALAAFPPPPGAPTRAHRSAGR